MNLTGQQSFCRACGQLFNSVAAFDKHRTGHFGKDRRCMTEAEMQAKGMAINGRGRWVTALRDMGQP